MIKKSIIAVTTQDKEMVEQTFLKAVEGRAPVLTIKTSRYVCLYVPYDSNCEHLVGTFRANLLHHFNAKGVEAIVLTPDQINRYDLFNRFTYEDYERAQLGETCLNGPRAQKEDKYEESLKMVDDEAFEAAVYFARFVARKMNRPASPDELKDAWRKDVLMNSHYPNIEAFPLNRITRYVAQTFKPKPA